MPRARIGAAPDVPSSRPDCALMTPVGSSMGPAAGTSIPLVHGSWLALLGGRPRPSLLPRSGAQHGASLTDSAVVPSNALGQEVCRARSGPGLWPGPCRQARRGRAAGPAFAGAAPGSTAVTYAAGPGSGAASSPARLAADHEPIRCLVHVWSAQRTGLFVPNCRHDPGLSSSAQATLPVCGRAGLPLGNSPSATARS